MSQSRVAAAAVQGRALATEAAPSRNKDLQVAMPVLPRLPGLSPWVLCTSLAAAIIAVGLVSGIFLLRRLKPEKHDGPESLEVFHCQMLSIASAALGMSGYISPIATAYDMTASLGFGSAASGLVIGAYYALALPALPLVLWLTRPWNQTRCRTICVSCAALVGSAQLGFMAVAIAPSGKGNYGALRLALLVSMRLLMGFAEIVFSTIIKLMAQRITPQEQLVNFQAQYNSAVVFGMALGPLLSSAVCMSTAAHSSGPRIGYPSGVIGFLLLCMVPFAWSLIPTDLDASLHAKDIKDGLHVGAAKASIGHARVAAGDVDRALRKGIWRAAVFYELERTVSQVAIEVAASLILESEFRWPPACIGLAASSGCLLGMPINELFLIARRSLDWSDETSARFCTMMGAVGTLLLWPGLGSWLLGSDIVTILLAELLIFPSIRTTKSIMDAASVEFAMPGTSFSQEHCLVAQRMFSFTLGRFATPPLTRWLIHDYGRLSYMHAQLCLNLMGCVTIIKTTQAFRYLRGGSAPTRI
mmetsp:Transcript_31857/g.80565  ORF Transcript_31857/g.80565 Transcript_31857/m.80565 type:complete len:529 (-) Transcript_31857:42-1628(-)